MSAMILEPSDVLLIAIACVVTGVIGCILWAHWHRDSDDAEDRQRKRILDELQKKVDEL
jgi:nitrogen fixation-related uncharacterized protein